MLLFISLFVFFFFFNDTATTEIYTLSLHDALPIYILQVDFQLLAEDALYRNLGRLHAQRVVIEAALAERERTLFGLDQTLFLYDVTSTYFEGRALANPKAKRGYSRDHRPDSDHPPRAAPR